MHHSYPLDPESANGSVPTGIAVQDGNYGSKNAKRQADNALSFDFAADYLHVGLHFLGCGGSHSIPRR